MKARGASQYAGHRRVRRRELTALRDLRIAVANVLERRLNVASRLLDDRLRLVDFVRHALRRLRFGGIHRVAERETIPLVALANVLGEDETADVVELRKRNISFIPSQVLIVAKPEAVPGWRFD